MLPGKTKNQARAKKWSRDDLLKVLLNPKNIPKIMKQHQAEERRKQGVRMQESKRPRENPLRKQAEKRMRVVDHNMTTLQQQLAEAQAELKKRQEQEEKTQPDTQQTALQEELRQAGVKYQKMLAEQEQQKAAHTQLQQQFSTLEDKAAAQHAEFGQAQQQFAEKEKLFQQGQTQLQDLQAQYEGLQQVSGEDKNKLSEFAKQIEANAAQFKQQQADHTAQLGTIADEREKERAELKKYQTGHTHLAAELDKRQQEKEKWAQEMGRRGRTIDTLEEQVSKMGELETKLQEQEMREAEQFSYGQAQNKKFTEAEQKRKELETQMTQMKTGHEAATADLRKTMKSQSAAATQKIVELTQAVQTGNTAIESLRGKLGATMDKATQLNDTIQSLEGQKDVSEKKLAAASSNNQKLSAEIQTLRDTLQQNERKTEELAKQMDTLRQGAHGDAAQLNADIRHRESKYRALRTEREKLEKKATALDAKVQVLTKQAQSLAGEKVGLQKELGAAKSQVDTLQSKKLEFRDRLEKLQAEKSGLATKLGEHQQKVQSLDTQITAAKAELTKVQRESESKIAELNKVRDEEKKGSEQDIMHLNEDIKSRDVKQKELEAKIKNLYVQKGQMEGQRDEFRQKFQAAENWRRQFDSDLQKERGERQSDQRKFEEQLRTKQQEWDTFRQKTTQDHARALDSHRQQAQAAQQQWAQQKTEFQSKMQNIEGTIQQRNKQIDEFKKHAATFKQKEDEANKRVEEAKKREEEQKAEFDKRMAMRQRQTDAEYRGVEQRHDALEEKHSALQQQHAQLSAQHQQAANLAQRHATESKRLGDEVQRLQVLLEQTALKANLNEGKAQAFFDGLKNKPDQDAIKAHFQKLYEEKLKEVGQQLEQEKTALKMRFADAVDKEHDKRYTKEMKELQKKSDDLRKEGQAMMQTMQDMVKSDGKFDMTKMKSLVDKLLKGDLRSPERLNKMLTELREKHRKLEEKHDATTARRDELEKRFADMKVGPQDVVYTKHLESLLEKNPAMTDLFTHLLSSKVHFAQGGGNPGALKDYLFEQADSFAQSQLNLFRVFKKWNGAFPVPVGLKKQLVRAAVGNSIEEGHIPQAYNFMFKHFFDSYEENVRRNIEIAGTGLQGWSVNELKKSLSTLDDKAHTEGSTRFAMRAVAEELGIDPRTQSGAWKNMPSLLKTLAEQFVRKPDLYAKFVTGVKSRVDPNIQKLDPQNQIDDLKKQLKEAKTEHQRKMKQAEDDYKEQYERLRGIGPDAGTGTSIDLERLKNDHERAIQQIQHEHQQRIRELEGGRDQAFQERDEIRERVPMLEQLSSNQAQEIERLQGHINQLIESGEVPDEVVQGYLRQIQDLRRQLEAGAQPDTGAQPEDAEEKDAERDIGTEVEEDEQGDQDDEGAEAGDMNTRIAAIRTELLTAIAALGQNIQQRPVISAVGAAPAGRQGPPGAPGPAGPAGPSGAPYVSRIPSASDARPGEKLAKLLEAKAQEHTKRAVKRRRRNPLGDARKKYMDARKEARAELTKEKANIVARIKKDVAKMARGSRTAAKKRKMGALKSTWKLFTDKYPHWKKIKTIAQLRKLTETVKTHRLRLK